MENLQEFWTDVQVKFRSVMNNQNQILQNQENLEKKLDLIISHFNIMEPVDKDEKIHDIIKKGIEEIIRGFGYSEVNYRVGFSVRAHLASKIRKEFPGMTFAEILPYFRKNDALRDYEREVQKEALGG